MLQEYQREYKFHFAWIKARKAELIDFDATRLHKPAHENDTVVLGTTGFAAPEQYGLPKMKKTICRMHRVRAFLRRRSFIYAWLSSVIQLEFEEVRPLKEGPRGGVFLLRHKKTGRLLVFRRFSGSGEVYRKLLHYSCRNLSQSDAKADIYSLGILMNVMLTGELPSRRLASGRLGQTVQRCT